MQNINGRAVTGIVTPVYWNAENVNFNTRLEASTKDLQISVSDSTFSFKCIFAYFEIVFLQEIK